MKNILKLAAALLVLASNAPVSASSTPNRVAQPTQESAYHTITIKDVMVSSAVGTARFTPPEFCYVGRMKVACTFTDAPSKDPTKP